MLLISVVLQKIVIRMINEVPYRETTIELFIKLKILKVIDIVYLKTFEIIF